MPNNSWNDLMALAESEGSLPEFKEPSPGRYSFVIVQAKAGKTKDGSKDQINARIKVLDEGPEKGNSMFHKLTLSPENPKALNIFFRELNILGVDQAFLGSSPAPSMEQIAAKLDNAVFEAEVYKNGEWTNLKNFRTATAAARQAALNLASGAPQIAAVAPTVPAPAVAPPAPAPAAPAVATPAPVVQEVQPATPEPVAPPAAPEVAPTASVPPPPPPPPVSF